MEEVDDTAFIGGVVGVMAVMFLTLDFSVDNLTLRSPPTPILANHRQPRQLNSLTYHATDLVVANIPVW